MAELVLKIGSDGGYEDGDVVDAFNGRRICWAHAEMICGIQAAGANEEGLRPLGSLAQVFREKVCRYRFERIGETKVRRVEIATGQEETFGPTPNARGEAIDVPSFLQRRLTSPRHAIFGAPGKEVWYGGRTVRRDAGLDELWQVIEARTTTRQADCTLWPAGRWDLRGHLFVGVDDFDDATLEQLKAPLLDPQRLTAEGEPTVIKKRKHRVDWLSALGLSSETIDSVRDRQTKVDGRARFAYLRADVVKMKDLG